MVLAIDIDNKLSKAIDVHGVDYLITNINFNDININDNIMILERIKVAVYKLLNCNKYVLLNYLKFM